MNLRSTFKRDGFLIKSEQNVTEVSFHFISAIVRVAYIFNEMRLN